jgi:hypothetical protein
VLNVELEGFGSKALASVAPSMHIDSPIPYTLIEAISVRFLPLFFGTRPKARSPLGARDREGDPSRYASRSHPRIPAA